MYYKYMAPSLTFADTTGYCYLAFYRYCLAGTSYELHVHDLLVSDPGGWQHRVGWVTDTVTADPINITHKFKLNALLHGIYGLWQTRDT